MRILQVSEFFPPVRGGLEFHVNALAGELGSRGHEVHVATLTRDPTPEHGVTVHTIPTSARLLPHEDRSRPYHPPLPDPVARHHLERLVLSFEPDIVHGHNWLAVSLPRNLKGARLVYTAHDYSLVCQLRTLLRYDETLCLGPGPLKCLNCGRHSLGAARSGVLAPGTALGRRLLTPDRLLAVSDSVARALRGYVGCPVDVVPNFLAPVNPPPSPDSADLPRPPYVLYAGDPGRHKGVDDLLAIWRDEPPAATLVLALTRNVSRIDLPPRVVVRRWDREVLLEVMRRAVAVIAPSRWPDPFPSVVIEALSMGTPVVATDVGGMPSLVTSGVNGLLVERDDRAALRDACNRLVGDTELRSRLSQQAQESARPFRLSTVVDRVEATYHRVLAA